MLDHDSFALHIDLQVTRHFFDFGAYLSVAEVARFKFSQALRTDSLASSHGELGLRLLVR